MMNLNRIGLLVLIIAFNIGFQCSVGNANPIQVPETQEPQGQDSTLRSGTGVEIEGFIDGLIESDLEAKICFSFENDELVAAEWMFEFMEGERDGGSIQKRIEADDELKSQVIAKYDIFLDATHGVVCNGPMRGWELGCGQGAIIDMGEIPLDEVTEAPEFVLREDANEEGYSAALRFDLEDLPRPIAKLPVLREGHTYVLRTGAGNFAKMHITKITLPEEEMDRVNIKSFTFDWVLQTDGTRNFE